MRKMKNATWKMLTIGIWLDIDMWIMLTKKLPTKPSPPKLSIFWAEKNVNWSIVANQFLEYVNGNSVTSRRDYSLLNEIVREDAKNNITSLQIDNLGIDDVGNVIPELDVKINGRKRKKKSKRVSLEDFDEDRIEYFKKKYSDFCNLRLYNDDIGFTANEVKSVSILYKGQSIKVLGHEYNVLTDDNVNMYIFGEDNMPEGTRPSHEFIQSDVVSGSIFFDIKNPSPEVKEIIDSLTLDGCTKEQAIAVICGYDIFTKDITKIEKNGWYRCRPEYAKIFCHDWEMEE